MTGAPDRLTVTDALHKELALDGLRAVAVMAVLFAHFGWFIAPSGFLGVDMFFVLSGFLITRILIHEYSASGRIRQGRFYARRALRLYPALLMTTIAVGLVGPPLYAGAHQWVGEAWISDLYLMDIARATGYLPHDVGPLGVTWSLAVEEHFYLLWPLFLRWALPRWTLRRIAYGTILAAGLCYMILAITILSGGSAFNLYYRPDGRSGAILIGCAAAILGAGVSKDFLRRSTIPVTAVLLVIIQIRVFGSTSIIAFTLGLPLVWVLTALLVLSLVGSQECLVHHTLSLPPLTYLGRISYGVYLYQLPVITLLADPTLHLRFAVRATGSVLIPIVLAVFSYELVERRFLEYGHRRFPRGG